MCLASNKYFSLYIDALLKEINVSPEKRLESSGRRLGTTSVCDLVSFTVDYYHFNGTA
jgi:hypothetical protein